MRNQIPRVGAPTIAGKIFKKFALNERRRSFNLLYNLGQTCCKDGKTFLFKKTPSRNGEFVQIWKADGVLTAWFGQPVG